MKKHKIEWTEQTWNPVTGCREISPGCQNCYARDMHRRLGEMERGRLEKLEDVLQDHSYEFPIFKSHKEKNDFQARIEKTKASFKYQQDWHKVKTWPDELKRPYTWKKPRMIFVCSMSDLFHDSVSFFFINDVMKVAYENPQHTFQILTKRARRVFDYENWVNINGKSADKVWPSNVWLGMSVTSEQEMWKVAYLAPGRAKVKWLSLEPLLGSIQPHKHAQMLNKIDWFVVGGESGNPSDIRMMKEEWVQEIKDFCDEYQKPFFFKQTGRLWICHHNNPCPGNKGCRFFNDKLYHEFPVVVQ
jgi:protein gp37